MSNKNMEMMKKIIEEKKKKSAEQGFANKKSAFDKNIGESKKPK